MYELNWKEIEEKKEYEKTVEKVIQACFEEENIQNINIYLNVILTNSEEIKKINIKYRNINKATDVLSFPMFEKNEIIQLRQQERRIEEVLGDIVIAIDIVEKQALEYGHSFERELAYMLVHGFYHIMGYDHLIENDKKEMRTKEEKILGKLDIKRS